MNRRAACLSLLLMLTAAGTELPAQQADDAIPGKETTPWPSAIPFIIGHDDGGKEIQTWIDPDALNPLSERPLILVVIHHNAEVAASSPDLFQIHSRLKRALGDFNCIFTTCDSKAEFPPKGPAYHTPGERAAAILWRTILWTGPDLVIECTADSQDSKATAPAPHSLTQALQHGKIPAAQRTRAIQISLTDFNEDQPSGKNSQRFPSLEQHSPLRQELQKRARKTPKELAHQLGAIYGHDLKTVMYQPALAVKARLVRAASEKDQNTIEEIKKILEPWLEKGTPAEDRNQKSLNTSMIAGHLIFAEWANQTADPGAIKVVLDAANHAFDENGNPLSALPGHNEMSDAVFMGCPILTAAGRLTGDEKYLRMSLQQLRFVQKLCLREDGLYRHSPLCEAAWGRGNGFPMLGLALALTDLEAIESQASASSEFKAAASEIKQTMLADFQKHAAALLPHQDRTGTWRQVIDEPAAYREMTATCMIGFALQRGVSHGWLDRKEFQPAADRAWNAVLLRCSEEGILLDVCTGTGKQKTLQDYFDRTAIFDRDERGGAMALQFAVERMLTE